MEGSSGSWIRFGYDSRYCMWTSLGSFMLRTYATAELLLPVASRVLLQLEKQSRQSEFFNVTEKPLISFPRFFSPWREVVDYLILFRCFHGPNVRPLCCCVLLLFLWYNSRIKSVTEIKKVKSMCWVLISWFCIFYQQQTVVEVPVDSIPYLHIHSTCFTFPRRQRAPSLSFLY